MRITEFLDRLAGVKKSGNGWEARCPAHDDHKPSLSITEGNDRRILVNCKAGCSFEAIVRAMGLKPADLFQSQGKKVPCRKRRIVATYPYRDEIGNVLFETVRFEPKDFSQRRPDPQLPGNWIKNLHGVRRVLYRLPELKAAIAAGQAIYIAEGEKDCLALVQQGFAATCNPLGAKLNGSTWLPEHTDTMRDATRVVIIADKDETGRAHASLVASRVRAIVSSAKVIELPDVNGKTVKDAYDFFAAGGSADELRSIGDAAPEFVPGPQMPKCAGQNGQSSIVPSEWFAQKFPSLGDEYGAAVLEETNKEGTVCVRDIGEDFFAASLGEKGRPDAPTVFIPTEEKFYTYSAAEGVFLNQQEPVLLARLSRLLLDCAGACKEHCETKSLEFRFRDAANLSGILRKARGLLAVPHDFFATNLTEFIPCANGMLRLSDKELQSFSPSYRRRSKLAVPFDSSAKCPLFLDTLMRAALDSDNLDLLQRWFGLALIGGNLAQKIVILTGTAGGGKGTFIRVLNGIIGQTNLATLRPQLLGERFEIGRFLGKTLLYGADVPENFLNQRGASILKSLTGGDPMALEFKNSNESPSIICNFNVIVTCNSRLTVHLEGDTDAWRRRLVILPYQKPKSERLIVDLAEQILRREGSGVLNFAIEGLDKLRADGWQLLLTASQQTNVDNLLLESDGLTLFVCEALARIEGSRLTVPDCFSAYVEFCNERGWAALTRKKFGDLIGDAVTREFRLTVRHDVLDAGRKAQRGWNGLRLRETFSQPTGNPTSGASEPAVPDGFSDEADGVCPVQPTRNLVEDFV